MNTAIERYLERIGHNGRLTDAHADCGCGTKQEVEPVRVFTQSSVRSTRGVGPEEIKNIVTSGGIPATENLPKVDFGITPIPFGPRPFVDLRGETLTVDNEPIFTTPVIGFDPNNPANDFKINTIKTDAMVNNEPVLTTPIIGFDPNNPANDIQIDSIQTNSEPVLVVDENGIPINQNQVAKPSNGIKILGLLAVVYFGSKLFRKSKK